MADLQASTALAWGEAGNVQNAAALSWGEAANLQSRGSTYAAPSGGGTVITPNSLAPLRDITAATRYTDTAALSVVDLRSSAALPVTSVSLDLADGSDLWTLQAAGNGTLADTLRAGDQPATVEVTLGTDKWRFVVEEISQPVTFESTDCTFRGRSLAAAAGAPYQAVRTWIADAPTTPAQIASLANTYTGVAVAWGLVDWLVPEGAWSASADPLSVVRQMAASAGAVVEADRTALTLRVRSRYPVAPNLWATQRPDVQIAWEAVESAVQERNDQPEYDGVLVAGLQTGGLLQARLEGTAGTVQAQMVTDPLLTEPAAMEERARAVLYAFGGRARETRTLQLHGGVVERGALVRCVDPAETWVGMVRSVSVRASLDQARQTITMERPTSFPAGATTPEPIVCVNDPLYANVVLLLQGDSLIDLSSNPKTVVLGAGASIGPTGKFGDAFQNGGCVVSASSDFNFGTGNWTVEAVWQRASNSLVGCLVYSQPTDLQVYAWSGDGRLRWTMDIPGAGSFADRLTGFYFSTGAQTQVVIQRRGNNLELWAGVTTVALVDTYAIPGGTVFDYGAQTLFFGRNASNGQLWAGSIDQIRVTRGAARYSSTFFSPDLPFCPIV